MATLCQLGSTDRFSKASTSPLFLKPTFLFSLSLSFSFVAFPLQKKTFFFFCWGINLDFFLIQTVSIFFFLNVARLTLFLIKLLPTKSNPRQYIFRLPVCSLLQSVNSGLRTYCLNQLKLHTEPANQHV